MLPDIKFVADELMLEYDIDCILSDNFMIHRDAKPYIINNVLSDDNPYFECTLGTYDIIYNSLNYVTLLMQNEIKMGEFVMFVEDNALSNIDVYFIDPEELKHIKNYKEIDDILSNVRDHIDDKIAEQYH